MDNQIDSTDQETVVPEVEQVQTSSTTQTPNSVDQSAGIAPNPTTPKTKKKWILPAVAVLVVLVIGTTTFFVFQKYLHKGAEQEVTQSETVTPTIESPSPTPDPTADWVTFTDPNKHFSFKYPPNVTIDSSQKGTAIITFSGLKQAGLTNSTQEKLADGYIFQVADLSTQGISALDVTQKLIESANSTCKNISDPIHVLIDNRDSMFYTASCVSDYSAYVVENDSIIYGISETYSGSQNNQQIYKEIMSQIVSTFKFLDTNNLCKTDSECRENYFCDYSVPGGMGPNGAVSGEPQGTQTCIKKCIQNSDCSDGVCKDYEIINGDIRFTQKGCQS